MELGQSQHLHKCVGGVVDVVCVHHLHLADSEARDRPDDELRYCVLGADILLCDHLLVYPRKEFLYGSFDRSDCG